jgi:hypothetical protein
MGLRAVKDVSEPATIQRGPSWTGMVSGKFGENFRDGPE